MFRTLTARFAGTCKRCKAPITPGQTIRYGGPGRTYHLANFCADADASPVPDEQPQPDPLAEMAGQLTGGPSAFDPIDYNVTADGGQTWTPAPQLTTRRYTPNTLPRNRRQAAPVTSTDYVPF